MSPLIDSLVNSAAPSAHPQPVALDEARSGSAQGDALAPASNPLHAVQVNLQVCVGQAAMTVGQLLAARENDVLALDRGVEQPVDLLLEGRVVARGQLVAVDGHFGVRITELPLPLSL